MANLKKVSILIYSLAGGGAERVVSILLKELKDEFDIYLVLMRDKIDYEIPNDTKIHFLENSHPNESGILKLLKLPILAWKYKKFCKKYGIQTSISFMNRPNYINVLAKLFGSGVRCVISERAMPSLQHGYDNFQSKINCLLISKLYKYADSIIANSVGNKNDLIENFRLAPNKVQTIYNPFDINLIDNQSKEQNSIKFKDLSFITIGRLDAGKNHALLISAFAELNHPKATLYILGKGELKESLETQIRKLRLQDRVFLLGFDPNPYKYLIKAFCFVFSSNHEGFPNVVIEALACGLPVISTDCKSGPREILAPNSDIKFQLQKGYEIAEYGILCAVNDKEALSSAMKEMIENKELVDNYHKKASLRAKEFDKSKIVPNYKLIL